MNITDSPWWPGHTGEDATAYVNAFRHVHDVFVAEMARLGMTNIEWMWSPNYASNPPYPWNDIHNYYPGDRYVDWIGLSGYNWNRGGVPWMTFSQLYDSVLKDFACNYAKPVLIAEIGSVDGYTSAENKPAWISDAYLSMQSYGFLRGVTWFNDYAYDNVNQPDFRVTTSTRISGSVSPLPYSNGSWTNSYKTSISPSVYTSQLPLARNVTPPFTYCGTGEPVFNVSPATTILPRGESSVHTLTGISYSVAQSITINPPKDISAVVFPSALTPPWDKATITLKISPNASYGIYSVPIKVGDVNLSIRVSVLEHVYRNYAPLIDR
jgi:hypothetical protein